MSIFFFQAEDGIRDGRVTGVQTCALPISTRLPTHTQLMDESMAFLVEPSPAGLATGILAALADPAEAAQRAARGRALIQREYSPRRFAERSEERRVGKGCRGRWAPYR